MHRNEFLRQFESVLEMKSGSVKGTETLEELGVWDSLAVVAFMAFVDEKLGLTLSAEKISKCKTVPDLVALLDGKVSQ